MRLILHVKDIGSFEVLLKEQFPLDDESLVNIRTFLNAESLYIQLVDKSYLFLGKDLIKNAFMVLETEDETDLLPEL